MWIAELVKGEGVERGAEGGGEAGEGGGQGAGQVETGVGGGGEVEKELAEAVRVVVERVAVVGCGYRRTYCEH